MDVTNLIKSFGYIGLFLIIFAESGLLVGFFLPGDSLLFTAGLLASQGALNIFVLIPLLFVAAVLGVHVGYRLGQRFGSSVFSKPDSLLWNQKHIARSQEFFDKHGGKTIILARFTPVVRSLAPIMAGVGDMKYRRFMAFNIIGAALWVLGITLIGYFFGHLIPNVDKYILPLIFILMLLSFIPPLVRVWSDEEQRALLLSKLRRQRKN